MEIKKSPKATLEKKRLIFLQIGLIMALGFALLAFEWKTPDATALVDKDDALWMDDQPPIPPTYLLPKPPPPPPIDHPSIPDIIENDKPDDWKEEKPKKNDEPPTTEVDIPIPDKYDEPTEPVVFMGMVGQKPRFPGCENLNEAEAFECFKKGIMRHIIDKTEYPSESRGVGAEGKVYISFIINKDGKVDEVKVVRGVDRYLDKEAARVVASLPDMQPAKQMGKPVAVRYSVPISFHIR